MTYAVTNNIRPIIWTIAGSDCSGGAGAQADVLTIHNLGGHACSVVTCITAQNSQGVSLVTPVDGNSFKAQLSALADDMPPVAIKIGMLASLEQVQILVTILARLKSNNADMLVVFDPVLSASVGGVSSPLGFDDLAELLSFVDVLTPNIPEAEAIARQPIKSYQDVKRAAKTLLTHGVKSVWLKGGHVQWLPGYQIDYWTDGEREIPLKSASVDTSFSHGTGCTLSSALCTVYGTEHPLEDALVVAKAYINQGLNYSYAVGHNGGTLARLGWPEDKHWQPRWFLEGELEGHAVEGFAGCGELKLGLYPVVDSASWIERILPWGVKTIQLRIKDPHALGLKEEITKVVALGREYGARVFINDYWQLAIEAGAYGVHLGQEDLLDANLEEIRKAGLRLGISTHGYAELLRAMALQPSYIALGHIFPTQTKDMPSAPQGLERLRVYQKWVGADYPTVAIGGIKAHNAAQVLEQGVSSFAVVTAITEAAAPEKSTLALMELFHENHCE